METDTATNATARLEQLLAELASRGWDVELSGTGERPYVRVCNPHDSALNGMVTCRDDLYRWTWGPVLGHVDDVTGVADRIVHVLREVST